MKTFTTILKIIVIGAVITIGLSTCGTFGTPKELDEETLALIQTLDSASWEVKAMKYRPIFNNTDFDFRAADKMELTAFQNALVTQNMETYKWYALSAPEMPGTYYYYTKYDTGSFLSGTRHELYKSTTTDAETFASVNAFLNADWQVKAVPGQPSTNGLVKIDQNSMEANYLGYFFFFFGRYEQWYSLTAPEMPGTIYYYFERTPVAVRILQETRIVYKGIQ
jgi:hypothetical protein